MPAGCGLPETRLADVCQARLAGCLSSRIGGETASALMRDWRAVLSCSDFSNMLRRECVHLRQSMGGHLWLTCRCLARAVAARRVVARSLQHNERATSIAAQIALLSISECDCEIDTIGGRTSQTWQINSELGVFSLLSTLDSSTASLAASHNKSLAREKSFFARSFCLKPVQWKMKPGQCSASGLKTLGVVRVVGLLA